MLTETFTGLRLIADLTAAIGSQLNKLKGTPKKRLGETLISLLVILKRAAEDTEVIIDCLGTRKQSRSILLSDVSDGKLEYLLNDFGDICYEFFLWVERHRDFSMKIGLVYPNWEEGIDNLRVAESIYGTPRRAGFVRAKILGTINGTILENATNAEKLKIRKQFQEINRLTKDLIMNIRKLAIDNLTLEDLL